MQVRELRVVTNIVFLIRESVGAQANTHYVSGNCDAAPLVRLISVVVSMRLGGEEALGRSRSLRGLERA